MAAAFLFVAAVVTGCLILAVTSLNGYTLLLLLATFGVGRWYQKYHVHR